LQVIPLFKSREEQGEIRSVGRTMVHKFITTIVNLLKSSPNPYDQQCNFRVKQHDASPLKQDPALSLVRKYMRHCRGNGSGAQNVYDQALKCVSNQLRQDEF
jgi:hypothetical protein